MQNKEGNYDEVRGRRYGGKGECTLPIVDEDNLDIVEAVDIAQNAVQRAPWPRRDTFDHTYSSNNNNNNNDTNNNDENNNNNIHINNNNDNKVKFANKEQLIKINREIFSVSQFYSLNNDECYGEKSKGLSSSSSTSSSTLGSYRNFENSKSKLSDGDDGDVSLARNRILKFGKFFCSFSSSPSTSSPSSSALCSSPVQFLCTIFPIIRWLRYYRVRDDLIADVITGVTVLALHIPQGLAYGKLAGAEPIHGLYVSLFPAVIYAIFGGSRQISIGTFAVISIACRDVVENFYSNSNNVKNISKLNVTDSLPIVVADERETLPPIVVLTSLCLLIGVIQFCIASLRLGVLATLLSDPIISGFCVGAATHVFTSQVFAVLGIPSDALAHEPSIPSDIVLKWYRIFYRSPKIHWTTVAISATNIVSLLIYKRILEPYVLRRFPGRSFTLPIDIVSIVTLTAASYVFDWHARYGIEVLPPIAANFSELPALPRVDLWPRLFSSALVLAFVIYASTYSLQKMYARANGYEIWPNQELFAIGMANIVSSFFMCFPCSGSLARSAVQDKVGGRTQLASLISSALIVIFLLFLSKFLETLPRCALSCIIIVALLPTFFKLSECARYWRVRKLDGLIWFVTFVLVVLFGVDRGLLFSLAFGLGIMILELAIPQFNLKHQIIDSECYVAANRISTRTDDKSIAPIKSSSGVIVFEFHGPLIFVNVERFKRQFLQQVVTQIREEREKRAASKSEHFLQRNPPITDCDSAKVISALQTKSANKIEKTETRKIALDIDDGFPTTRYVILDASRISYVDAKAAQCLLEIDAELRSVTLTPESGATPSTVPLPPPPPQLYLANLSEPTIDTLFRAKFFDKFSPDHCFVTVHDAVMAANRDFASRSSEAHPVTRK